MGVYAVWEMVCDHAECGEPYQARRRNDVSARAIRWAAARDGWHATQRGKVYCPDHIPNRYRKVGA